MTVGIDRQAQAIAEMSVLFAGRIGVLAAVGRAEYGPFCAPEVAHGMHDRVPTESDRLLPYGRYALASSDQSILPSMQGVWPGVSAQADAILREAGDRIVHIDVRDRHTGIYHVAPDQVARGVSVPLRGASVVRYGRIKASGELTTRLCAVTTGIGGKPLVTRSGRLYVGHRRVVVSQRALANAERTPRKSTAGDIWTAKPATVTTRFRRTAKIDVALHERYNLYRSALAGGKSVNGAHRLSARQPDIYVVGDIMTSRTLDDMARRLALATI